MPRSLLVTAGVLAAVLAAVLWHERPRGAAPFPKNRFAWPLRPFDRPHPLRATFGEPRALLGLDEELPAGGDARARALQRENQVAPIGVRNLHSGVDIAAPDGTPVYALTSGVARTSGVGLDQHVVVGSFGYWHLIHPVPNGTRVVAFRTAIGRIYPGQHHLHLSRYDAAGQPVNPLIAGGLTPYADTASPAIGRLVAYSADGQALSTGSIRGPVALAVRAADRQSTGGLETGLYRLRWSLWPVGARRPVLGPVTLFQLDRLPSLKVAASLYTVASTRHGVHARFWYRLHERVGDDGFLHTERLPAGRYRVVVKAWDARGNLAERRLPVRIVPYGRS